MPPLSPWPIYGIISGAVSGVTVTATNNTSDETQTYSTESDSSFLIDAANFDSGYTDGDIITISTPGYTDKTATINITSYPDGIGVYLSKPSTFDPLNWQYRLLKSIVIPGYTSQSTGEWVLESSSDMIIRGHISDISIKDLTYLEPGMFALGDRKISLDKNIGLVVSDYIKISEDADDSEVTEWFVKARQNTSALLSKHAGIARDTFLLKRKL